MCQNSLRIFVIFTLTLLLFIAIFSVNQVLAQDSGERRNGGENEIANGLGGLAVWCLAAGAAYVVLRRLYLWSKTWGDENLEEQELLKSLYGQYRKPLLYVHNVANIAAVVIGGIHGLLLLNEQNGRVVTGIIAWAIMVFLCVFGFLIFLKLRLIWDNREVRGFLKFMHRQWILSIILIIVLLIHMAD